MTETLRVAPAAPAPAAAAAGPATRAFLAVAALGAGLLHAALAPSAPPALLVAFLLLAVAELAWAAATLAKDRPPLLRSIPALALLPVGMWAALAVVGATASGGTVLALPLAPMGVASLLDVAVAATAAIVIRRGRPHADQSGFLRFFAGLVLSACVVSAVTIPALTLTDAGIAAVTVHHHH